MNGTEIGIVDTRNVIRLVNEMYGYDFGDHALTSFKRGLERIMVVHNLKNADSLLSRLREDPSFLQAFLHGIVIEPTEMFRDPSLWRMLRDDFLFKMATASSHPKVWFPYVSSPEELLTFSIVLEECGIRDKFSIAVSCLSEHSMKAIQLGNIRLNKLEVSEDNYTRYHGKGKLSDYCRNSERFVAFDPALLRGITCTLQKLDFENTARNLDLIFFRNQLLYFNQGLQDRVVNVLFDSLSAGGYLVLGAREKIQSQDPAKTFRCVNEEENIYQKK